MDSQKNYYILHFTVSIIFRLSGFPFLLNIEVIDCGDPSSNLTLKKLRYKTGSPPQITYYLITTNIVCDVGYRFDDGELVKNITCNANGRWSIDMIARLSDRKIYKKNLN